MPSWIFKIQKLKNLSWNGTKKSLKKKEGLEEGEFYPYPEILGARKGYRHLDFTGSKIAPFSGRMFSSNNLRDDKNIPGPNSVELPGGGREGDESPSECAAREVYEELGIHLTEDCLLWSKVYPSMLFEGRQFVLWSVS